MSGWGRLRVFRVCSSFVQSNSLYICSKNVKLRLKGKNMKIAILIATMLFVVGCGGISSENSVLDDIAIKPLIKGKLYYEEDLCNDPEYKSYVITEKNLIVNSYSDADYSELVATNIYPVLKFKEDEVNLQKGKKILYCSVGYNRINKVVTMFELDCVEANNPNSPTELFFFAYDTKEGAHKNRNTCK